MRIGKMKNNQHIDLRCDTNCEILAHELSAQLTHDELFEFITELDANAADWDLTEMLCKHFNELMKTMEKEDDNNSDPKNG